MKAFILSILVVSLTIRGEDEHSYLLSTPLTQHVKMSKLTVGLHGLHVVGWSAMKAVSAGIFLGPVAAATCLACDLPMYPQSLYTRPFGEFKVRALIKNFREMKKFSVIPNLKSVRLLSAYQTDWKGIIPVGQKRTSLVVLDTSEPLPHHEELIEKEKWRLEWGAPLKISKSDEYHLDLTLRTREESSAVVWSPNLYELLGGMAIPRSVQTEWADQLQKWSAQQKSKKRGLAKALHAVTPGGLKDYRVEAMLKLPDGNVRVFGSLAEAGGVASLLGNGIADRMNPLRRSSARSIPVQTAHVDLELNCRNILPFLLGKRVIGK